MIWTVVTKCIVKIEPLAVVFIETVTQDVDTLGSLYRIPCRFNYIAIDFFGIDYTKVSRCVIRYVKNILVLFMVDAIRMNVGLQRNIPVKRRGFVPDIANTSINM